MDIKFLVKNRFFNIFILLINTSITDSFFQKLFISPGILSLLRLVINLMFIFLITFYFLTKRIIVERYLKIIGLLLILGVSILWTTDRFETIKLFINFIGIISNYIIIFTILSKEEIVQLFYRYSKLIVILNVFAIVVLGPVAFMGENGSSGVLRGIHLSRSAFTTYINFTIFAFMYFIALFPEKRKEVLKAKVYLLISIGLVLLSKSSTGILTVGLFIPLLVILKYKVLSKIVVRFSILMGMLITIINFDSGIINVVLQKLFGKTLTFSGRKYIWDYVFEHINNHSIIGNGFNSTRLLLDKKIIPLYDRVAAHAHNGFLEIFLQNGIIGLILIILILVSVFKLTFYFNKKEGNLIRSYFIIVIIFNYMEPYLINNVSFIILWMPLIYVIATGMKIYREKINE